MKNLDNPLYYEQYQWEEFTPGDKLKIKIKKILDSVPSDAKTIIDIGCGNGLITNQLAQRHKTTGVDRSEKALKYVKTTKILSSSDNINVDNGSFDMVFSSELLEHLGDISFLASIKEMKRISKKYIFLTFPNDETIEKDFIKCPACDWVFNRSYHLRSLNLEKIKKYFPEFFVISSFTFGTGKRGYNNFLLRIKHKFASSDSWIPDYWTKNSSRRSMCPKCENSFQYAYRFNLVGFLCDKLNMLLSPHKPYWLFILLEKAKDVK